MTALERSPRRPCDPSRARRGYTVIEVLLAMTVLVIGAAGVMTMQKASMQGNVDARKTDIAANIARLWMERVQKDAMQWTLPSPSFPGSVSNLPSALLLNHAPTFGSVGTWFLPTDYLPLVAPSTASISPGFDVLGRDIPTVGALTGAVFCVHLRESWLAYNTTNPTDSLLRVELRVVWPRGLVTAAYAPPICDTTSVQSNQDIDPTRYSTLYMVTAVRANGLQ